MTAGLRAKVSPGRPPPRGAAGWGPGQQPVLCVAVPGSGGPWAGKGPGLRPVPRSSCDIGALVRNSDSDIRPENLDSHVGSGAPGALGQRRPAPGGLGS